MKKNTLSHYLKELRIKLGYTQQEMADKLKIDRSYYSQLETGRRTNIRISLARKIAEIANDEPATIYGLRGN